MACVNPYKISVFFDKSSDRPRGHLGFWGQLFSIFIEPFLNRNISHCFVVCCYEHSSILWTDGEAKSLWQGVYIDTNMYSTCVQVIDQKTLYGLYGQYSCIDFDRPDQMVTKMDRVTFPINTCVGSVKKVLGIKAWWVQTPYQLYKYLLKMKDGG